MKKLFTSKKPIIAVVYLPPLLGYPNHLGMSATIDFVLNQVQLLENNGVDGVLLENENDRPYKILAPPEIIASMALITSTVTSHFRKIKIGVEFLLNDPKASIAIAQTSKAHFIRTDYFVDRMKRDEYGGEMSINPKEVIQYRKSIDAENILLFTDIQVKYAQMLDPEKTLVQSMQEAIAHQSSGVVVSGNITGVAPGVEELRSLKTTIPDFPILIGSGLNPKNAHELLSYSDGAIVGSSLMDDGVIVDHKVKELMKCIRSI